jgi:hypothetical protein
MINALQKDKSNYEGVIRSIQGSNAEGKRNVSLEEAYKSKIVDYKA